MGGLRVPTGLDHRTGYTGTGRVILAIGVAAAGGAFAAAPDPATVAVVAVGLGWCVLDGSVLGSGDTRVADGRLWIRRWQWWQSIPLDDIVASQWTRLGDTRSGERRWSLDVTGHDGTLWRTGLRVAGPTLAIAVGEARGVTDYLAAAGWLPTERVDA